MAGIGSGDLHDLCLSYLDACALALEDTPAGAPERQFISPGPPPWDCEQLAVFAAGPSVADTFPLSPVLSPGHRAAVQGMVYLVTMVATVIRCVPGLDDVGNEPSPTDITHAASQINADLWAIWCHVARRKKLGTLFPPKESELYLEPTVVLNQAGGFAGWQIMVRVQLDGYRPAGLA